MRHASHHRRAIEDRSTDFRTARPTFLLPARTQQTHAALEHKLAEERARADRAERGKRDVERQAMALWLTLKRILALCEPSEASTATASPPREGEREGRISPTTPPTVDTVDRVSLDSSRSPGACAPRFHRLTSPLLPPAQPHTRARAVLPTHCPQANGPFLRPLPFLPFLPSLPFFSFPSFPSFPSFSFLPFLSLPFLALPFLPSFPPFPLFLPSLPSFPSFPFLPFLSFLPLHPSSIQITLSPPTKAKSQPCRRRVGRPVREAASNAPCGRRAPPRGGKEREERGREGSERGRGRGRGRGRDGGGMARRTSPCDARRCERRMGAIASSSACATPPAAC